jgi:hypothetical protein
LWAAPAFLLCNHTRTSIHDPPFSHKILSLTEFAIILRLRNTRHPKTSRKQRIDELWTLAIQRQRVNQLGKTGDAKWYGTARTWTNSDGAYRLIPEEAGQYVLGSMIDEAPYALQPFQSRYYPGVPDALSATIIRVVDEQLVRVEPMRLLRLPLVRVAVTVVWQDGRPEPSSSILFQSPMFPHEPGIGSASVFPDGDGRVPLPADYDYVAVASAQCDTGTKIESCDINRVPLSTKAGTDLSRQIRLILPRSECNLWHPV